MTTSGCINSRGTLRAISGDRSSHRQAVTFLKPWVGPPSAMVPETQVRMNLPLLALLAPALLPFGVKLSLPQNSCGGIFALIHQKPVGLVPW